MTIPISILMKLSSHYLHNVGKSLIDNFIFDKVKEPAIGSLVHVELLPGFEEHSGIYIGNNQIVELNRQGNIKAVLPREFMEGLSGVSIYVPCRGTTPVGSQSVAMRAKHRIGTHINYCCFNNNCHMFSAECLNGQLSNKRFSNCKSVIAEAEKILRSDNWRVWDYK